jgi:Protein of unknown function (DUF2877)
MDVRAGRPHLVVDLVGVRARQILCPGSDGQVLAGRSRALYLLSSSGELTWLAPRDVPMHRRTVRLAAFDPLRSTDTTYRVTDGGRLIAPSIELDLHSGPEWRPPRFTRERRPPADVQWHRQLAAALLRGLPEPRGYGALLPWILGPCAAAQPEAAQVRDRFPALALASVLHIADACRDGDLGGVLAHSIPLVGWGEGLTPSGDDFLGGLLFGFASLGWEADDPAATPPARLSSFVDWSKPRTNVISHALLRDHAAGEGPEVLERFAVGLLERWPLPAIRQAARELILLGHTTGWSLLAGAWMALALVPSRGTSSRAHTSLDPVSSMC